MPRRILVTALLAALLIACGDDEDPSPTASVGPSSTPTSGPPAAQPTLQPTPEPTPEPGSVSQPVPFSLVPLDMTPEAPSTIRDDPAAPGPQTVVYDTVTESLTVAGDGIRFDGAQWLDATRLLLHSSDALTIYDAKARTWSRIESGFSLDDRSRTQLSDDGSRLAVNSGNALALFDFGTMTYRVLNLAAKPVQWSPDGESLLIDSGPPPYHVIRFSDPTVSLDLQLGTRIDFFRWLDNTRVIGLEREARRLLIVDVSGADPAVLADAQIQSDDVSIVTLSPDGRRVAVAVGRFPETPALVIYEIGSRISLLGQYDDLSLTGGQFLDDNIWTRDGSQIVLPHNLCNDETLVRLDVSSGATTELSTLAPYALAFSPDESQIAVTAGTELYLLPSDGSAPPRLVFEPTHAPVAPSWSPDGRFIAFGRYFGGYDRCP